MTNNCSSAIVVYTSMVGDLFHIGHLNLIKRAKDLGTTLIVGVIVDECVNKQRGFNGSVQVAGGILARA